MKTQHLFFLKVKLTTIMSQKPWVSGPIELLCHGLKHIENGSDFDLRMTMISIDNAVEVSIYAFFQ